MNDKKTASSDSGLWSYWRGLSGWNFYFLIKFTLLWFGYLNFHPLANLVFMAFLLMPIPSYRLHRARHIIAIPIGIGLLYHDTWLPSVNSIMSQGSQLANFSTQYLLELTNRFINWPMIGIAFIMLIAYLFLAQWLRVTVFTVSALTWLNVVSLAGPAVPLLPASPAVVSTHSTTAPGSSQQNLVTTNASSTNSSSTNTSSSNSLPTNENLNVYLNQFYDSEKKRVTTFPTSLPTDAQPFNLLVINICSLAWSDLENVGLQNHPLWARMDLLFTHFNSATAYSGPAAIRMLRASCGQPSHSDLYQPASQQCYLFDNLAKLGFKERLMLDHSGVFGDFLTELRQQGGIQAPVMSQAGISNQLTSFDGGPVYNDQELLGRWLEQQQKGGEARTATFFNLIPLHDGMRFVGASKGADYQPRAQQLLDQLNHFLDELEQSGRKVMVVIVPEHGAALAGDKMQMSGLRDIPSWEITHTPVGIKLIGMQVPHTGSPLEIQTSSSYLALSELVSRLVDGKIFSAQSVDWQALIKDLPQTAVVAENSNAIVMQHQGNTYIRLNNGDWVLYPQ